MKRRKVLGERIESGERRWPAKTKSSRGVQGQRAKDKRGAPGQREENWKSLCKCISLIRKGEAQSYRDGMAGHADWHRNRRTLSRSSVLYDGVGARSIPAIERSVC